MTRVAHGYCSRHLTAGACPLEHLRTLRQKRERLRFDLVRYETDDRPATGPSGRARGSAV